MARKSFSRVRKCAPGPLISTPTTNGNYRDIVTSFSLVVKTNVDSDVLAKNILKEEELFKYRI